MYAPSSLQNTIQTSVSQENSSVLFSKFDHRRWNAIPRRHYTSYYRIRLLATMICETVWNKKRDFRARNVSYILLGQYHVQVYSHNRIGQLGIRDSPVRWQAKQITHWKKKPIHVITLLSSSVCSRLKGTYCISRTWGKQLGCVCYRLLTFLFTGRCLTLLWVVKMYPDLYIHLSIFFSRLIFFHCYKGVATKGSLNLIELGFERFNFFFPFVSNQSLKRTKALIRNLGKGFRLSLYQRQKVAERWEYSKSRNCLRQLRKFFSDLTSSRIPQHLLRE